MDYRCPKHDLIFETLTDQRKPGASMSADKKFPAHPVNGHPDCPLCQEETENAKSSPATAGQSSTTTRKFTTIAQG